MILIILSILNVSVLNSSSTNKVGSNGSLRLLEFKSFCSSSPGTVTIQHCAEVRGCLLSGLVAEVLLCPLQHGQGYREEAAPVPCLV